MAGKRRFRYSPIISGFLGIMIFMGCAAVFMTGCASVNTEAIARQIDNTEMIVNHAKQGDAQKYAPLELKLAEESLDEAKSAMNAAEYDTARRKAEVAMEQARFAEAKTEAEKAKKHAKDKQSDLETLRKESNRIQKTQ